MNPDVFLAQEDVHLLVQAINTFALEVTAADDRKDTLVNAGVHLTFRSKLNFGASPHLFANQLVACFREYRVSERQPAYHPLLKLLEYLLHGYELEDQDRNLFTRLIGQGQENLTVLTARRTVGRIDSPPGTAFGTGVLVDKRYLLTCHHVIERIFDSKQDHAWVRFGYKMGKYGVEPGEVFELDIKNLVSHNAQSDYALVRIMGEPPSQAAPLFTDFPHTMQNVRLIHHPQGEPVQISEVGQIVQVDKEYVTHNIKASHGSSGAPIFDLSWRVVAIHRGTLSISRPLPPGITEGVPLYSIWKDLKPHLSALNS